MKLLLNAMPFGYGPVSKICTVAKCLSKQGIRCTFCGSGIAYEFMKRENVCEVIYCDLYKDESIASFQKLTNEFSYGITCMEPLFVKYASKGISVSYIDSLIWMWDKEYFNRYPELKLVDHYFVQNTFFQYNNFENFGIKNPEFVGAIIDVNKNEIGKISNRNGYLVNYGGVENIYINENINESYPFKMTKLLSENNFMNSTLTYCCNKDTSNYLAEAFPNEKINSFSHMEFIKEMVNTKVLITTPGLTTLLEAYSLNIPILFLPPQNYSQYLILKYLKEEGYPGPIFNYDYFYDDFIIEENIIEDKAIEKIKKITNVFLNDIFCTEQLIKGMSNYIQYGNIDELTLFQSKFIEKIGTNGAMDIVQILIKNKK